ncbi:MAG: DUF6498-containing protein [Gemmatimonadales bacterium]
MTGSGAVPYPRDREVASIVALVLANALPLIGVLWFHWQVFPILLVYWLENVVIGGFNVLKMLTADPAEPVEWIGKLFIIPFFCVHFGLFTFVHGTLVFSFFGKGVPALAAFRYGFLTPTEVVAAIHATHVEYAWLALLLSHGFSFVWNYLLGGEYKHASLQQLMREPYSRVITLHLVVLFGAAVAGALGSPTPALVLLVALKIGIDVNAHRRERAKFAASASAPPLHERGEGVGG